MVAKADSPIGRKAERHRTQMISVPEGCRTGKTLLGEESSGCSGFSVEATLPVEQNVGGDPAVTDCRCVSLGTFILVPLAWTKSTA